MAEGAHGRLYGFFDLRRSYDGAEVWAMFIEPGLKRTGVGRALGHKLETCARSMGVERISLLAETPSRCLPRLTKSLTPRASSGSMMA
ncbi:MAG: N-acetyltransferase [Mesorhizobium sp.]|uniref:GNAT family N-acetyltransferase n=1 Tax=Mesorhizobium sp. TaxID=1871066 RepID=UPI000FE5E97A|nr:MAG: N-acetyltransferase [Mesorhizobium sp.]